MRTMHLFAGGGGGLLADLILGHTPIVAVEWDRYACAVLRSRAADGWFPGLHVHEGDVRLFDPSEYAGRVGCIHAGFPCQDISSAGKGAGITGERSGLYTEVMRAIDAIRPAWVMLENSPLIRTRGRHIVIADLVARGYSWRDGVLSAADVGANHRRNRWWCLAYSGDNGRDERKFVGLGQAEGTHGRETRPEGKNGDAASDCTTACYGNRWWDSEPNVGRVADGDTIEVHQIKCLGNGQVPLCAATAWKLLGGP